MDRRKLWGIQIFGWGIILTSLVHIHMIAAERDVYFKYYAELGSLGYLRYAFSWFQRIAGLAIGIGLLKRLEPARIGGMVLGAFTILTIHWKHPYPAFLKHTRYLDAQFDVFLKIWNIPAGTFESLTFPAMIGHCVLDILFWLVFIYYMTRPRVRANFRSWPSLC